MTLLLWPWPYYFDHDLITLTMTLLFWPWPYYFDHYLIALTMTFQMLQFNKKKVWFLDLLYALQSYLGLVLFPDWKYTCSYLVWYQITYNPRSHWALCDSVSVSDAKNPFLTMPANPNVNAQSEQTQRSDVHIHDSHEIHDLQIFYIV